MATDVLVVDDDEPTRSALRSALEDCGYTVFDAPDGQFALDRLRNHPRPLVVVLDWLMPGLDGIQVLHALAADATVTQRHVFLLITAATINARPPLPDLPPDQDVTVLYKPFDLEELIAQVRAAESRIASSMS